jgi:membrane-associated phospholipid phosphatase
MLETILASDTEIIHWIQSIGPTWFGTAWFLSALVGYSGLIMSLVIVALALIGKRRVALETSVIYLVSLAVTHGLKVLVQAPRPFQVDSSVIQYVSESSFGMPSGHALVSCAVLGWVLLRHPKSSLMTWGIPALIVLIGLSRVYLGVHYPSQVLAGWIVGLLLIWLFSWIDRFFLAK